MWLVATTSTIFIEIIIIGVIIMSLLEKNVYISINGDTESFCDLLSSFGLFSVETKSCTGFEIVTLIMQLFNLIIVAVSVPAIWDAINREHIIVTIDGWKFNDHFSDIINAINSDSVLLEKAKEAYKNHTIEAEGNAESILKFRKELQKLIDKECNEK